MHAHRSCSTWRVVFATVAFVATVDCTNAFAWGCEGHRAVVFIAERLLPAATLTSMRATLSAAPTDSGLRRFCDAVPDDPIADASTWADDYRDVDATTFRWHFIDVPRGATLTPANEHVYCPRGNCAVEAIAAQFRSLTTSTEAGARGNALRFLLHFVGDLHQPLHATTNGDRGGNCVPVTYHDRTPVQNANGDFSPNLHVVWDSGLIGTAMMARGLTGARALAAYIAARHPLPARVEPKVPTREVVTGWAQQAHSIAETVVYPRLPTAIPREPASAATLVSCAENRDVVHRMLAKHEVIDARYEQSAIPAILDQLRLAGIRLAAVLGAAYR
jgi:hypothetical protein